MAASSSQLRSWWDDYHCETSKLVHIDFFDRKIGGVAEPTVDAFKALEMVLKSFDYEPTSRWAYNCRNTASGQPSLHGYGIAIDIDPRDNPATSRPFSWSETKFTPKMIDAVEKVTTSTGEQVWAWGGRWNSFRDYMHFQIDVPPKEVANGINWNSVAGFEPPGPKPPSKWAAESWQKAIDKGLIRENADPHIYRKGQWFIDLLGKLELLD